MLFFLIGIPLFYLGEAIHRDRDFRIDGLLAGTYEIAVSVFVSGPATQALNIPPTRQTVAVTSGAVAEVTITLQMPKPVQ